MIISIHAMPPAAMGPKRQNTNMNTLYPLFSRYISTGGPNKRAPQVRPSNELAVLCSCYGSNRFRAVAKITVARFGLLQCTSHPAARNSAGRGTPVYVGLPAGCMVADAPPSTLSLLSLRLVLFKIWKRTPVVWGKPVPTSKSLENHEYAAHPDSS